MTLPTTAKYFSSLKASQRGKNGHIVTDVVMEPRDDAYTPDVHKIMGHLANEYADNLKSVSDQLTLTGAEETLYTGEFHLWQEEKDGDVFCKINLEPKVGPNDTEFPLVFELVSAVGTRWLLEAGIIDLDGNLVDEDSLHKSTSISATSGSSVH